MGINLMLDLTPQKEAKVFVKVLQDYGTASTRRRRASPRGGGPGAAAPRAWIRA